MGKAALETKVRNGILAKLSAFLDSEYDADILPISASEICLPMVDEEGNEIFAVVKVSIPRGKRVNGGYVPFDGYAEAEDWKLELEERENKLKVQAEEKERKEREKERKRQARKTIRTMKKDVQEILGDNANIK